MSGTQVQVQRAADIVDVSGQEIDGAPRIFVEVGIRRHEDAVVSVVQPDVGDCDTAALGKAVAASSRALDA